MTLPPAIAFRDVTYRYHPGATSVMAQVSFEVAAGEFVGVLGPNGAGKSTLLRLASGSLSPGVGTVRVAGVDPGSLGARERARRVAVVPQTESPAFGFTARAVVEMGRTPHVDWLGGLGPVDRNVVGEAIARCDVTAFADRPCTELSGGEWKRVQIARALAQQCPLVLLDEPVAHLDVAHQLALCDLLAAEVAAGRCTAVAVLHDLNLAAQYCTRLLLLREGGLVACGSVEDVMTYRRIRDTFSAEVFVGVNELNDTRFFVPTRPAR